MTASSRLLNGREIGGNDDKLAAVLRAGEALVVPPPAALPAIRVQE